MPTLQDIKAQSPAYAALSDEELADKLYNKYYAGKLSRDDFNQKVGYTPEKPKSTGQKVLDYTKNVGKGMLDTTDDIGQGLVEAPLKLGQMVSQGISSVLPKSVQNSSILNKINTTDIDKLTAPLGSGRQNFAGQFSRGIGEYAPYGLAAGENLIAQLLAGAVSGAADDPQNRYAGAAVGTAANALPIGIGKGLEALRPSKLLKTSLSPSELQANTRAAQGTNTSLGSVLENPGLKKLYENTLTSLSFTGADDVAKSTAAATSDSAKKTLNDILGSTDIKDINSGLDQSATDALKSALGLDSLAGTQEQLNQVGGVALKNALGSNSLEDVNRQLGNKGSQILSGLFGSRPNPQTAVSDLVQHVEDKFGEENAIKKGLYDERNEIANEDPNFKMDASSFEDVANKFAGAIDSTNLLKYEPDDARLFSKLKNYRNPNASGKPYLGEDGLMHTDTTPPTLQEATLLKGKLSQYARDAERSPDASQRGAASVFKRLAAALNDDINRSIESSGNTALKAAHEKANDNYAKKFAPFLDRNVYKYIGGNADPDTILNAFIKTGANSDRSNLAESLAKLPGDTRKLMGSAYFSRAIDSLGNVDPYKLSELTNKLGANQFKALVPSERARNQLTQYATQTELARNLSKALGGDGSINQKQLATVTANLRKNPTQFKALVPSPVARAQLNEYGRLFSKDGQFSKAINQDGSINHKQLANTIHSLEKSPTQFRSLVSDEGARQKLIDYTNLYDKTEYFKKAMNGEGGVNRATLSTLVSELNKNPADYNRFIPQQSQAALSDFQRLQYMNKDLQPLYNPKTGAMNMKMLGLLLHAASVGGGAAAHGYMGAIAGLAAPSLLGHTATHYLTSESAREAIVKEMLNPRKKFIAGHKNMATQQALTQALMQSLVNQGGQ